MTIKYLICIMFMSLGSYSCSYAEIEKIESWSCSKHAGFLKIPNGWKKSSPKHSSSLNVFKPDLPHKEQISITVDVFCSFDPRFPKTQLGCAESYLDGIRDVSDETVKLEKLGEIKHPLYGGLKLFRYSSKSYGDHLVVKIVTDKGYSTIELNASDKTSREKHEQTFIHLVKSIDLNNIK